MRTPTIRMSHVAHDRGSRYSPIVLKRLYLHRPGQQTLRGHLRNSVRIRMWSSSPSEILAAGCWSFTWRRGMCVISKEPYLPLLIFPHVPVRQRVSSPRTGHRKNNRAVEASTFNYIEVQSAFSTVGVVPRLSCTLQTSTLLLGSLISLFLGLFLAFGFV